MSDQNELRRPEPVDIRALVENWAASGGIVAESQNGFRLTKTRQPQKLSPAQRSGFGSELSQFTPNWRSSNRNEDLRLSRSARGSFGFIDSVVELKESFGLLGFKFKDGYSADWAAKYPDYDFGKLVRDIYTEWSTVDNFCAYWQHFGDKPQYDAPEGQLPIVFVPDCESVEYCGGPSFGVHIPAENWHDEDLNPQVRDHLMKNGGILEVNRLPGQHGVVCSTAKNSAGFGKPKIKSAFFDLAIEDQLRSGDWNGSYKLRNLIRHVTKGHKITNGQFAGMPTWFMKKKDTEVLKEIFSDEICNLYTNFDVEVGFKFLDPEYMTDKKYTAVENRIAMWMGPLYQIIRNADDTSGNLMTLFRTEVEVRRERVKFFLERIFNSDGFAGRDPDRKGQRVEVEFFNWGTYSAKELRDMLSFALKHGICSTPTARAMLGFDNVVEGNLIERSHQQPERYRPVFEPGQGLVDGGDDDGNEGRDPEKVGGRGNEGE